MGIAENKRIVLAFMERLPGDQPDWDALDEDVRWWIQGIGTLTKAEFQKTAAGVNALAGEPARMFINHVTAEDDRVAVEARSEIKMRDGRVFENTYHFLYILRGGKIIEAREHFDTGYARDFFGKGAQTPD